MNCEKCGHDHVCNSIGRDLALAEQLVRVARGRGKTHALATAAKSIDAYFVVDSQAMRRYVEGIVPGVKTIVFGEIVPGVSGPFILDHDVARQLFVEARAELAARGRGY